MFSACCWKNGGNRHPTTNAVLRIPIPRPTLLCVAWISRKKEKSFSRRRRQRDLSHPVLRKDVGKAVIFFPTANLAPLRRCWLSRKKEKTYRTQSCASKIPVLHFSVLYGNFIFRNWLQKGKNNPPLCVAPKITGFRETG